MLQVKKVEGRHHSQTLLFGGIASVFATASLFPIDLAKARLQNQPGSVFATRTYRSLPDCLRKCYKQEGGMLALYRGAPIHLLLSGSEKTLKFAVFDKMRTLMNHYFGELGGNWMLAGDTLAGGVAGAAQVLITTPMDLIKIHQQDAGRSMLRTLSASELAAQIFKERGFVGLYRGLVPTALRDIGFSMVYFPLYRELRWRGALAGRSNRVGVFSAAFVAAAASALLVTPFDVVKSRLQTMRVSLTGFGQTQKHPQRLTFMSCCRHLLLYEGPYSFLRGAFCRMLIVAPVFALFQTMYDMGMWSVEVDTYNEKKVLQRHRVESNSTGEVTGNAKSTGEGKNIRVVEKNP